MGTDSDTISGDAGPHDIAAPAATTLALISLLFVTCLLEGREISGDFVSDALLLPLAVLLSATSGRLTKSLIPLSSSGLRVFALSSSLLVISLIANLWSPTNFDHMFIASVFVVGMVSAILNESGRLEESSVFFSIVLSLHIATTYAAGLGISLGTVSSEFIDVQRTAIGTAFFTYWFASVSLAIVVLLAIRGPFQQRGSGKMLSVLPTISESRTPLIYSALVFASFLIPLIWLGQIGDLAQFSQDSHLGFVWGFFGAIVVLIHAFFRSEGWHVLGSLLAINWILYTIGHLHEIGNQLPSLFSEDGFIGSFSWFFLGFWLNFFAIFFSSRGVFGDIAPRREKGSFRIWWGEHSYVILIGLAFIVALVVRTAWYVIPALNAAGTGLWDLTGGSDPWYMKRIVDYVIAERSHLIFDHDRAYPTGGINPRPPLFSWSLALGGLALSWLLEISVEEAVWWSVAALPAIYGALIVFPISGIATRAHSRNSGIIAAWLIALMPGHMGKSTFAMSDHDSFAMLFLAIAFYYWIKALDGLEHKKVFETASYNPLYIIAGMRETWKQNPTLMANATMAGVAFSVMALGWKGYVYGPGILFLAYAFQVALNIFRGRDSLQFTSAALQMLITCIVLPLPFYAWPGMNLVMAPSGMQPMFYILGFTFAVGWVSSSMRDKPWLLVVMSGTVLFGTILSILFILQAADLYNGWDILFTGGFYFSKNKIFGTIGEAQAPDRGRLFASYGPIVALIAIGCAFVLLWRGSRKNKSGMTLLGLWAIIATYMAWTAGRFIMNATPVMAVVGGVGISMLWGSANFSAFTKVWRNSGIGTPRSRFRSIWPATKSRPGIPAMIIVLLLVTSQHTTYGIDAGIPAGQTGQDYSYDVDEGIYNIAPDIFRQDFFNLFSLLNSKPYDPSSSGLWYMGTFGQGFNSPGWNDAFEWLSEQDSDVPFSERPAFVSWWDYGFQALASGQHPTVADNFQSGIPHSGAMLLSAGQEDTLAMFIATLAQADRLQHGGDLSDEFNGALSSRMTPEQQEEFTSILKSSSRDFVLHRTMEVSATYEIFTDTRDEIPDRVVELLHGHILDAEGIPEVDESWIVLDDGKRSGEAVYNESDALALFDQVRGSSSSFDFNEDPTHYFIGDYRYTPDLINDYYDVSTSLHRANAKFGMSRAFLTMGFELGELVDIYDAISSIDNYEVSSYDSSHGETITRNHEIRYFGVDDKLFPKGGGYYGDYQGYHWGQPTGILHAPTRLSGLDLDTYITETWETIRGNAEESMTKSQYETEYFGDLRDQAAGVITGDQVISMTDIDYQHEPAFFETMVARTYVGYGTSTLGLPGPAETPSTWLAPQTYTGAPNSYLEGAMALPGAMMNHFVLSNWYDETDGGHCELNETGVKVSSICGTIYDSNRIVKILKYYSGATIEGTVNLDGIGVVPNARILIERDAFSGDEEADANGTVTDHDSRTYWIPIGSTQADANGAFSFTVPAGKIRVSAFTGEPNLDLARSMIQTSDVGSSMYYDTLLEENTNRNINPVTGILGNVYGSTWLSETIVNISGTDGHSNGESIIEASISVTPSSASGLLTWSGEQDFDGSPVTEASVILTPSSDEVSISPYVVQTSDGSMSGETLEFNGIGEVSFSGEGTVVSEGVVSVSEFTGTHTQTIYDNHSVNGDGQFEGRGILAGTITGDPSISECVDGNVSDGDQACSLGNGSYLINGTIDATGKFTSEGVSMFTRTLSQATFIGSGTFETDTSANLSNYGTVNGTGIFSGAGVFSGPMVQAGTFHVVDALPGEYTISVDFGNGTLVNLTTPFTIPLSPIKGQEPISIAGGSMKGTVLLHSGRALTSPVSIYPATGSVDNVTDECAETVAPPCMVTPDEGGSFLLGPIIPGSYVSEVDIDGDGFPEISYDLVFESNQPYLANFPSEVPQMSDITFTLEDDGEILSDELEMIFRPENQSMSPVAAIFDNESDTYSVELPQGTWILNYTLNEDKQLWQIVEISGYDMVESYEFSISQIVNGSVHLPPTKDAQGQMGQGASFQEVVFQWDGFTLSTTADSNGNFSVVLPQGSLVDAIAERTMGTEGFLSNGSRFTVTEDMEEINIELADSVMIFGSVSLNREGNTYNYGYLDWKQVDVISSNSDGEISGFWREEVNPSGLFEMLLPLGNWTFVLDAGELGSSTVKKEINTTSSVELLLYPADESTVRIELFVDHSRDNNASNGTYVSYPFEIKPLTSNGSGYSVSLDGDEWYSTGRAELSLEPGKYRIVIDRANASADEQFDTLYDVNEIFDVGMDSTIIVERSVGFEPLWLVNITFRNESGELLRNHDVVFHNQENGWIQTHQTDDQGLIVDYMEEGDWVVIVDEFETYPDVFEGLREKITVSQENAGARNYFQTTQLASVSVYLSTNSPSNSIGLMYLKFTSQEGLGYFTAEASGFDQPVEIRTTPGLWNVEMNQTSMDGVRILVENTSLIESGVVISDNQSAFVTVQTLVELSGRVFWDLDADGLPSFNEGLENATVTLDRGNPESPDISHVLTTNANGEWATFLPAMSHWNITVEKEGYGTETSAVLLEQTSDVLDTEINAGDVAVSGSVSYVDQSCISGGNWDVVLLPKHGISRESVVATKSGSESSGWDGQWSASVEPGDWIVYASTNVSGACQYLVSIDSMEVDVDGANVESDLSIGGFLNLNTRWLDYGGNERELSDVDDYDLVINVGMGITWSEQLGDDGVLHLLLPSGTIGTSSDFLFDEGGRNVSYSGGQSVTVRAGQETPVTTLSIERISRQDLGVVAFPAEKVQVELIDSECVIECIYHSAQFTLSISYDGHNPFDTYLATATVPGIDGLDWTVEFQNISDPEGAWLDFTTISMGLDNDTSAELTIRVTPANNSVAHHFNDGHSIIVKFATQQGYSTQTEMTVQIPKTSGLVLGDSFEDSIYFESGQKVVNVHIPFQNLGNSDEMFWLDISEPEGWEISGPLSQPAAPFSDGTTSINLVYVGMEEFPDDYTGDTLFFTFIDSSNNSYEFQTSLVMDAPSLSIVGGTISLLGGGNARYGFTETYVVNLSNSGNVDANGVTLLAKLCKEIQDDDDDGNCDVLEDVNSSSVSDVPSMSQSAFYINMDYTQYDGAEIFYIQFEIDGVEKSGELRSCNSEQAEGKSFCVMEAQLGASSDENSLLEYMWFVFAAMLVGLLLYLTKRPGRRPSAPF